MQLFGLGEILGRLRELGATKDGGGLGGGEARKRFVEQGDDSLLFGEWGNGNFYLNEVFC